MTPDGPLAGVEDGATAILATHRLGTRKGSSTQLLYGPSFRTTEDARGQVHWIRPGQLVVFQARGNRLCTFVFRTVEATEVGGTRLPGVHRPVRLLIHTTTLRRALLLARLLRLLLRQGRDPAALPDIFYRRLDVVLSRRSTQDAQVQAMLTHYDTLEKR